MKVAMDPGVTGSDMVIAVPAAVLGAAGFGLATAVQQRATKEVETSSTLDPTLLVRLFRRPLWLLGVLLTVVALALQLLALAFGPLAVVQPLLVTGCVFAGVFVALMNRRPPDRWIVLGGLLCAVGLSAFLLQARPTSGTDAEAAGLGSGLGLTIGLGATVVASLVYAATVSHPSRILALALATGVLFGITAALMKIVTDELRLGLAEPFTHPTLYVACVVGPIGFLLSQNTFQQGELVSPAVAVITSVDPVIGVLGGVAWLGEDLQTTSALMAGESLAALVVIAGIASITIRGQHLLDDRAGAGPALGRAHPGTV